LDSLRGRISSEDEKSHRGSGCLGQYRLSIVNLIRCHSVKGLVGTLGVVEHEPLRKSSPEIQSRIKRSQIQVLVLERPPQPLDKDIVLHPASTIHAHGDAVGFQDSGESLAGELSPWSVLKISGVPWHVIASCRAATQNSASRVLDSLQESTLRLCQSMTAIKNIKPRFMGM